LPLVSFKRIPVLFKRCSRKLRAVLKCPIRVKGAKEGRNEWTNNKCTFQEGEKKRKKVFRNNASLFILVLYVITSFKSLFFFNKILIYNNNNNNNIILVIHVYTTISLNYVISYFINFNFIQKIWSIVFIKVKLNHKLKRLIANKNNTFLQLFLSWAMLSSFYSFPCSIDVALGSHFARPCCKVFCIFINYVSMVRRVFALYIITWTTSRFVHTRHSVALRIHHRRTPRL